MANYQLSKTGAEIDAALSLAVEHETSKANIDGAYENLTAGNAEQLISSVTIKDKVPYNFRTSGGSVDIGNRKNEKIVGGTLAWNQIIPTSIKSSSTRTPTGTTKYDYVNTYFEGYDAGHVLFVSALFTFNGTERSTLTPYIQFGTSYGVYAINISNMLANGNNRVKGFAKLNSNTSGAIVVGISDSAANLTSSDTWSYDDLMVLDLTKKFGSTIADYIFGLETATAGAGVAWIKKLFPKDYYAYQAGKLESVKASAHNTIEFNAWDEEWEVGKYSTGNGEKADSTENIRSKNKVKCFGNTIYACSRYNNVAVVFIFYDGSDNFISSTNITTNQTFTTPANCEYFAFYTGTAYGTTYKHDICINLSWDGERDGEYEAFKKNSYPLDDSLELRGIAKLDANNDLYYDGDEYESNGKVTRRYGVVDLGTLTWEYQSPSTFYAGLSGVKINTTNGISTKYPKAGNKATSNVDNNPDKTFCFNTSFAFVNIKDSAYSDAATFKTAMSGVYLVYELATATEETADAYQNPMIVDDFGTEEFVDAGVAAGDRDVEIPVGHDTEYQNNLRAKLEMSPDSPDGNGDYIVRQTNGTNAYVPLVIPTELPEAPSSDGTYHLKIVVSDGTATLSWEAET